MCSATPINEGTACGQGQLCVIPGTCQGGLCSSTVVSCTPADGCHEFGTCDLATGTCSTPAKADGQPCADGMCVSGTCIPGPTSGGGGGDGSGGGSATMGSGCACDIGGAPILAGCSRRRPLAMMLLGRRRRPRPRA